MTKPGLDCLAQGGGLRLGGHEEPLEVLSRGTMSSTSTSGSKTGKSLESHTMCHTCLGAFQTIR